MRAVSRSIDSIEELECVKQEEAEYEQRCLEILGSLAACLSTEDVLDPDFILTWDAVYLDILLNPFLLESFGVISGTALIAAGSFLSS